MTHKDEAATTSPQETHSATELLIHYGEIALKGDNRYLFEAKLVDNIRAKLRRYKTERIRKIPGRIIASFTEPPPWKALLNELQDVIGISSFSPAWLIAPDMGKLEETVLKIIQGRRFKTFAVRTRRSNKAFPLKSMEVNRHIGDIVNIATGADVELETPEQTVWIEIMDKQIIIYLDKIKGNPGLPVGVSGHVLSLLSGGIDSPVATWRMMARGCRVTCLHFHSSPFTTTSSMDKAEELARILCRFQRKINLGLAALGPIQGKIVTNTPEQYRVILYRRFMFRIAEAVASRVHCHAIITGEALGQVASQTISNIATVDSAISIPVLRPLIGMNKDEIIRTAEKIGTFDLSIQPHQDCCSFLQPKRPVTRTTREELEEIEKALDVDALVTAAIESIEWKTLGDVSRSATI